MKSARVRRIAGTAFALALVATSLVAATGRPALASGQPTISVGDVSVAEGDSGSVVVYVPVDLSAASAVKVTVKFNMTSGTATAGDDFRASIGLVTFAAGVTSKLLTAYIYPDTATESDETFGVHLNTPLNATIADGDGDVTILDDDVNGVSSVPEVSIGTVEVTEADGGTHLARLPITLSKPATMKTKVRFSSACSTASFSSDIQMPSGGTVTFLDGQQSKYIVFKVVADLTGEDLEQLIDGITVTLGDAIANASSATGGVVVYDDDGLPSVGTIERVSVASEGTLGIVGGGCGGHGGTFGSLDAKLSNDGRYVLFMSEFNDLVPGDTNGSGDLFLRDRETATTTRVNVDTNGAQAIGGTIPASMAANYPVMSGDASVVAWFQGGGFPSYPSSFWALRDLHAGVTQKVSDFNFGTVLLGRVTSFSDDGRYFVAEGSVPGAGSATYRIDRAGGPPVLIRQGPAGDANTEPEPALSGDGQKVMFVSADGSLIAGDTNNCNDVFVEDLTTGDIVRASVTDDEQQFGSSVCNSTTVSAPSFASSGNAVVFDSCAPELGLSQAYPCDHYFVRDLVAGTTEQVDDVTGTGWPIAASLDGSGRRVSYSFQEMTTDGVSWSYVTTTAYVYDRTTGITTQLAVLPNGTVANAPVIARSVSTDGKFVAFATKATNLGIADPNNLWDIYVERIS